MNDNNKLPEGQGNSTNGDKNAPPLENNNSQNRASTPQGVNAENANTAINKFAGTAKQVNNNNTNFPYNARNLNQPQSPVPPQSGASGDIKQKKKVSPVLVIIPIIVVMIVLVLIVGVLCGTFFIMSRKNKSDDSSSTSVSDFEETTESKESASELETQTTTAEKTTEIETTTETPEKKKILKTYTESDISKYPQYIKVADNDRDPDLADYFALIDINDDEIPELFLTDKGGRIYAVYTAVGDNYAELQRVGGTGRDWITLYNDGCISHGSSFGNDGGYIDYEYTGGKELKEIKSYSLDEYKDIPASHGGEASITASSLANYISKKPTISAYIEGKSYYPTGNGIEFILHTSGDYSYYHYEGYETGGGEDNVKCASGDTSESEVRITAGSSISFVKVVITPYNDNNAADETITVDYTVTNSQTAVEVYSCNAIGQINAPDGGPINGYATSYIVDRGTVSYTRTDLMDNWHITAVRYCVVNGITWYEIYDTDDGDYYGWLDSDHIDFY